MIALLVACSALAGCTPLAGCGGAGTSSPATAPRSSTGGSGAAAGGSATAGGGTAAGIAPVKWEPAFSPSANRAVAVLARGSRRLRVEVVEAACHPQDPALANPARRVDHVAVAERPYAVIVTVFVRLVPGQLGGSGCTPANVAFVEPVSLPQPIGKRAVVDGGSPRFAEQPGAQPRIRIPASDAGVERQAERVFGPPDGGVTP